MKAKTPKGQMPEKASAIKKENNPIIPISTNDTMIAIIHSGK